VAKLTLLQLKPIFKASLKNRGTPCIFNGYSVHHANDVYRMLNHDAKSIIQSHNMICLNEVYHDWIEKKVIQKILNDDNDNFVANRKIQEVNIVQDKLKSSQDRDELKKK
jgi:hypothetical protein